MSNGATTTQKLPIKRILRPFEEFARLESSGGILLFVCAVSALVLANSPWADTYFAIWQTTFAIGPEGLVLSKPILLWINDALMAVFFFLVGLEIKREVLVGELASARKAALPIAAAAGGMLVPAAIYLLFNWGGPGEQGWGIPMATDIAFALGVLTLFGSRIPLALKVFLTALAIVDDIGAVLVIAVFYTEQISWISLAVGAVFLLLLMAANLSGVRPPLPYAILGIGLWVCFLKSGIHATVAGVLVAMTIPSRNMIGPSEFVDRIRAIMGRFEMACSVEPKDSPKVGLAQEKEAAVAALEQACERIQSPMQRLEHGLLPVVTFFIMPLFALANAGVALKGTLPGLGDPVVVGIVAGLAIGKPLGILAASWLAVKLKIADLGGQITWRQILGVGCLGGIGFTMSLFVGALAFEGSDSITYAKLGIFLASLISGVAGWLVLKTSFSDS